MPFDSKYITPTKKALALHVDNGKIETKIKDVPKFQIRTDTLNGEPIFGTELVFDSGTFHRLFYPVIWAHKTDKGYLIPNPDFLIQEEIFFFNQHLKKEETELDLQAWCKDQFDVYWREGLDYIYIKGFEAIKIAFKGYINGGIV